MKGFLRGSKRSSAKSSSAIEDEVLSEMLLEVPTRVGKTKAGQFYDSPASVKKHRRIILDSSPSPSPSPPPISDSPLPSKSIASYFEAQSEQKLEPQTLTSISSSSPLPSCSEHQPDDKEFTRVFWYDAHEDQFKHPGIVYIFGRIYDDSSKRFVSCCTVVKNVTRTCYLLITHDSTYDQAVGEFTHITAKRFKIKNFTCEKVTKKCAFGDSKVPLLADYVKLDYPATQPALPANLTGETFSHVFNVNQTPLEKIILDLKLRGPCWLKLVNPTASVSHLTWAKVELNLESPENLLVDEQKDLQAPYFCTFSMSIRTYKNPTNNKSEIIAIAGMVNTSFNLDQCLNRSNKASGHFCIMTKPAATHHELKMPYDYHIAMKKYNKTRFELVDSERDLLVSFMEKFNNLDPDIVVGHDLLNFDYETLVMRMKMNKVGSWSQLGRFKRTELAQTKSAFRHMFSGRVLCDIKKSAEELINARSYGLTELTSHVLQKSRTEYNHAGIVEAFKSSEGLIKLLNATWEDNDNIFSILVELNVIPLALKITNITGNILSGTLSAGRSERNEYLLLHAFHEANFICPEKHVYEKSYNKNHSDESIWTEPIRKKAAYTGGLVLEPKSGYYDTCVLLMDFNSLYPSIIQEFNICFSTVKVPAEFDNKESNAEIIATVPDESIETGILPSQLRSLVERRRRVKRLLADAKSPDQKLILNIEQQALKLTANSMYGCLGFDKSRFYAKHLASLVTFKGREILMSTKAMVEKLGYEVIYGDTDSLMINTKIMDYDEVILRGNAIKSEINRSFKLLEIDIDGVYRPLLLLKKKNYAGASVKKMPDNQLSRSIETKGLDTVRRDRAVIAKEAGEKVLSMILFGEKDIDLIVEEIHNFLRQLGDSVRAGDIPREKYLISKQLSKNPEEFKDTKGQGHVILALRHNIDTRKTRKLKAKDTIEYVICLDNSTQSAAQRAYTLEEMDENQELKLDLEYYLCQQIHPLMTRICDKLPVTNAYVLAEMLGIEKSNMLHIKREESDCVKRDQLISKGEARFNSCKPLVIFCPNCNLPDEIKTRTRKNKGQKLELSLTTCPQCGVRYAMKTRQIVVQIIALIKQLHLELYNSKFVCENPECDFQTRNLFCPLTSDDIGSSKLIKAQPICDLCESSMSPEMDDRKMDLQLNYIKHLFDHAREDKTIKNDNNYEKPSEDLIDMYDRCSKEIDYALKCSFVNNIDAYCMFSMICSGSKLALCQL